MSAFDLFQRATCEIGRGDKTQAATTLAKALKRIAKDGIASHMKADLKDLRQALLA